MDEFGLVDVGLGRQRSTVGSAGLDEIGEGRVNQVRRGSRLGVQGRGEVLAHRKERGEVPEGTWVGWSLALE